MNRACQNKEFFLLIFGTLLIILGIIFNEWLISKYLCQHGDLGNHDKTVIRIAEIIMIVTGAGIIIFRKKELTINLSVLIITLFILSTGAEIFSYFFPAGRRRIRQFFFLRQCPWLAINST